MRSFDILVDVHEPVRAAPFLRELGHRVELRALGSVDYLVSEGETLLVVAERKTHRDLILSMIQRPREAAPGARRLWAQMDRFESTPGEVKAWIYERADGQDPYPGQFAQAMGALASVQERGHLLLPTRSLEESMRALVTVAGRVASRRLAAASRSDERGVTRRST